MENFLEETSKIIKEFESKSNSEAETIGRMAAEIYRLRILRLQQLKEKIFEIIDDCYSEYYVLDNDDNEISVDYFRYETCIEEIEKLFNEVE